LRFLFWSLYLLLPSLKVIKITNGRDVVLKRPAFHVSMNEWAPSFLSQQEAWREPLPDNGTSTHRPKQYPLFRWDPAALLQIDIHGSHTADCSDGVHNPRSQVELPHRLQELLLTENDTSQSHRQRG